MNKATLVLFNAIQVNSTKKNVRDDETLKRMLKSGYLLDEKIPVSNNLLKEVEDVIGLSGELANSTFHKSWNKVATASMEQLVIEQMLHYLTTYGYKALGVNGPTYFPLEDLEVPETKSIPVTSIRALSKEEILDEIINLGTSVALAKTTLDYIMEVVVENEYSSEWVEKITNRELKALLYDFYDITPTEPVEYLRFVVSKLTGQSLLIKNKVVVDMIKQSDRKTLDKFLESAPKDLASIFFRFKPLFLAMKSISNKKHFFNRLRKDANNMHKPLPVDYLNDVTRQISTGELDLGVLFKKLKKATVFRKIRLAYALNYRLNSPKSIVYKVRNGRGFASGFSWEGENTLTESALNIVIGSITDELQPNVDGKKIYIPEFMNYALPATEKQFTGNFPSGSYVAVPSDAIIGIHWFNAEKMSIDLDLSVIGISGKCGWDASYRNDSKSVLFSGDITDAPRPKGATELFYIRKDVEETKILNVNYFNFYKDAPSVDCKIVVANKKVDSLSRNYMIDPNDMLAQTMINIDKKQTSLGLIARVGNETRFYFSVTSTGNAISSSVSEAATHTRQYYEASVTETISLKKLLEDAGANLLSKEEYDELEDKNEVLNLAPEALTKTTILDLFK